MTATKKWTEASVRVAAAYIQERDAAVLLYQELSRASSHGLSLEHGTHPERKNLVLPPYVHEYLKAAALDRVRDLNALLERDHGIRGERGVYSK